MSVVHILALIAGGLFVLSLFPAAEKFPLVSVGGLLLSVAMLLVGRG